MTIATNSAAAPSQRSRSSRPSKERKMSALRTDPNGRPTERIGPEAIRSGRSGKEAELDEVPDQADERDEHDQNPPTRFVAIVEALRRDRDGGIEDRERDDELQE